MYTPRHLMRCLPGKTVHEPYTGEVCTIVQVKPHVNLLGDDCFFVAFSNGQFAYPYSLTSLARDAFGLYKESKKGNLPW
jgi:hypothetical protein